MTDDSKPAMARNGGLIAKIWAVKVRLQWSGWLQYLPPLLWGAICLFLGGLLHLLWFPRVVVWVFLGLGGILVLVATFDVITLKLIHPPEPIPKPPKNLDIFDLIRQRYSCRSFQVRKLTDAHQKELQDAIAKYSLPGVQIGNSRIRFEYVEGPLSMWPVVNARQFLIAIVPKEYCRTAIIDVGRSLQKVVMHATGLGIATCWIGPGADHASVKRYLGDRFDPERDHIACTCAVGYVSILWPFLIRLISRHGRNRLPLSELFFSDRSCREPLDTSVEPFSKFGRCYEACQWAPSSFNEQPVRCAAIVENGVLKRFDFFQTTASRWYAPVALGIWCGNWQMGCEALGQRGHFEVLPDVNTNQASAPTSPLLTNHYGVSWVLD